MRTVHVDIGGGHSLRCQLSGSGTRVITLLHGLAGALETWDDIAVALEPHARVLRFDLRGHGGSGSPAGEWTLAALTMDLIAVLDACGVTTTTLVGHSGGGVIAMHAAIHHPERIDNLVLAATASEANERAARWYAHMARKAEAYGGASVLADFGWGSDAPAPHAQGFANAARCMATLLGAPLTPMLQRIRCAVTVIAGTDDFIGVGGSVIIHRCIPGSRLEILPGRGHAVHRDDPESFMRLAFAWLSEVSPR